jgi:predicted outer membrane repeat protein
VSSKGALTLDHVSLRDGDSAVGGGIYNHGNGALTIIDSTFAGNRSEEGGAILSGEGGIDTGGPLTLTCSLLSANESGALGGGTSSTTASR